MNARNYGALMGILMVLGLLCLAPTFIDESFAKREAKTLDSQMARVQALGVPSGLSDPYFSTQIPRDENAFYRVQDYLREDAPIWTEQSQDVKELMGLLRDPSRANEASVKAAVAGLQPHLSKWIQASSMGRFQIPRNWDKLRIQEHYFPEADVLGRMGLILAARAVFDARRGDLRSARTALEAGVLVSNFAAGDPTTFALQMRSRGHRGVFEAIEIILNMRGSDPFWTAALRQVLVKQAELKVDIVRAIQGDLLIYQGKVHVFNEKLLDRGLGKSIREFTSGQLSEKQIQTRREALSAWLLKNQLDHLEVAQLELPFWEKIKRHEEITAREVRLGDPLVDLKVNIIPLNTLTQQMLAATVARRSALLHLIDLVEERYRSGTWPQPSQLSEDPFDGQPLRYRREEDTLTIYSIDLDQSDDGGTDRQPGDQDGPRDIVVRYELKQGL